MSGERSSRLVRARDLTQGAVILRECHGKTICGVPAARHGDDTGMVVHKLSVFDVETHDGLTTGVTVAESGEQYGIGLSDWAIVRVYVDTVPGAGS